MASFTTQRFGFPPDPQMEPPSAQDNRIAALRRAVAFLLSALFVSVLIHGMTIPRIFQMADVVPYVADGGVFGCQVRIYDGPVSQDK